MSDLHDPVLEWYDDHARDLPWRGRRRHGVVGDGLGVHAPADAGGPGAPGPRGLAGALADAGRAGRRADRRGGAGVGPARLPAPGAAAARRGHARSSSAHDGEVPAAYDDLLALPGVGDYTAAAIASFAFGQRHVVLDTNVRRVLARAVGGVEFPRAVGHPGRARPRRPSLLPDDEPTAATWAVAVMELGALVCTARDPRCDACPVADRCAWRGGRPPGVRRTAAPRPGLGRHRPAVPRPAAGRAPRRRRPGAPLAARRGVAGRRPARALPGRPARRRAGRRRSARRRTPCPLNPGTASRPRLRSDSAEASAGCSDLRRSDGQVGLSRRRRSGRRSRRDPRSETRSHRRRPSRSGGRSGIGRDLLALEGERRGRALALDVRRARSGRGRPRRRASSRRARPRSRAGSCDAAAAHRAPGRSPRSASRSLAAWVSSSDMSRSFSRSSTQAIMLSTIETICSFVSGGNTMISSTRLRNSGRKCCLSSSVTLFFIRS